NPSRAVSQVAGHALRMPASTFLQELRQGGALDRLLRRYIAYSLRYAYQTVLCNALHSVEQRMCRWLLMTHDRVQENVFHLKQEFLAEMLGVRRQTVTVIAGALQKRAMISYRRGVMRILDRQGLQKTSCECYQTSQAYYERIVR